MWTCYFYFYFVFLYTEDCHSYVIPFWFYIYDLGGCNPYEVNHQAATLCIHEQVIPLFKTMVNLIGVFNITILMTYIQVLI